jgi:hypothetical protein
MVAFSNSTTGLGALTTTSADRLYRKGISASGNLPDSDKRIVAAVKKSGQKGTAAQPDDALSGKVAAPEIPVSPATSATDKILGGSFKTLGITSMAAWLGGGLVNALGGAVRWTGSKTGINLLERAGNKIRQPIAYIDRTTLSDFGRSTGIGNAVSKVTQPVFNGAATVADKVVAPTLGKRGVIKHTGQMHFHLDKASTHANVSLAADHALAPHLKTLQTITSVPSGHVDMGRLKEAYEAYSTVKSDIKNPFASLPKAEAKAVGKFETAIGRAIGHHHSAQEWKDVKATVRNLPKGMAGSSIRHTLMNGSWIGLSGLSVFSVGRNFFKDLKALKQMSADMTGQQVSTLGLLVGNVPAPIAQARKHIFKNFFAREALETVGLAVNIKQARNGHINPLVLGAQILGSQGIDQMMGESVLDHYQLLKTAYQRGGISVADYASFLAEASSELKARGADNPFTQAIAQQYAQEKASPAQIMKEIANGGLMKRISLLVVAQEPAKTETPAVTSHVKKASGVREEKPVIGKHTGQLAKNPASTLEQGI